MTMLRLLLLPFRAPMLLVLLVVSAYLGLNWSTLAPQTVVLPWFPGNGQNVTLLQDLVMPLECLQAVAVVVICTVPDLLVREMSFFMARSKVLTLVTTLFLVITGGVYLMHLNVLTDVLLLGAAVLLARLDLIRIRMPMNPVGVSSGLSALVLTGVWIGHRLHVLGLTPLHS
ncbi:MAG: hypothetical protein NTZ53_12445 [Cyanobacteria bacterium]|nr:hypothetical protein [Cyanobacteriota bacterium]